VFPELLERVDACFTLDFAIQATQIDAQQAFLETTQNPGKCQKATSFSRTLAPAFTRLSNRLRAPWLYAQVRQDATHDFLLSICDPGTRF